MLIVKICPSVHYDWIHFLDTFRRHCSLDSRVLEVGASNLNKTTDLAKFCQELVGVELYSERIPLGGEILENVSYRLGDCENLSSVVEPGSFDLVVASHVIEHIPGDLKAVNEMYNVLKDGGVAIINTPNVSRVARLGIDFIEGARRFPRGEHQREYSFETFTQLFERSKFTGFEVTPVGFGMLGWKLNIALKKCPWFLRNYACFFEAVLHK